jgi:predicted CXXCH cytochrome family protein
MLRVGLLGGSIFCAAVCIALAAFAQEKHSDPTKSCVLGDCHADVIKHKYLHGPLVLGQCTVCHAPLPGNEHKFKLLQTDAGLCATCHDRVDTEKYLHEPVAKGKCLDCHDPHGSEERSQIRKSSLIKLCNDCHKKPIVTKKYVHEAITRGECLSCHHAHGSTDKNLLRASGSKLCVKCHEEMNPVTAGGRKRKIHLAEEKCENCHRSHDSDYPGLLAHKPLELCFQCHEELKTTIAESSFRHEAVIQGLACMECHTAHSSKIANLLRKPATDLCYGCHEDLQSHIVTAEFKHRPVADKSCGSCHAPHSSLYSNLLFADFPADEYLAYDPARYAFCFSCHKETIVRDRYTETDTNFRNGSLNLHYLHVNKKARGRSCVTCHSGHASRQPGLIHDEVPYGSWKLPVHYTRTKVGGSCFSGCHKEYTYDRVNPVPLSAK